MSKWTKVKAAMLAATSVVAALQFGGCLGGEFLNYNRILQLVAIGSIFD
jgi:hypothetical protein